jgi:hypothetical protein
VKSTNSKYGILPNLPSTIKHNPLNDGNGVGVGVGVMLGVGVAAVKTQVVFAVKSP